ncbi:MAG: hypothetical protein A2Y15_00465 [Clostridiales bacterium GWF2_36_10]|nr:MAG: hypothetical protein A2Y15_00465 [Clostridiales bacterium GWF2_36_10]HAN21736.1 hypothetical protein [Clostridiales bacterium]
MTRFPTWLIRGNREDYLINHHYYKNDGWNYCSSSGSLLYTYENIKAEDIEFFSVMPITMNISIEGCTPFTVCHGSPQSTREQLLPNTENTIKYLSDLDTDYLYCAHTHKPFTFQLQRKRLVNCASVGAPTNDQINAQFVSLEYIGGTLNNQLISVPYDVQKIISAFEDSGIYNKGFFWSKAMVKLLQTGINYPFLLIEKAVTFTQVVSNVVNVNAISEKYWEQAAKELKII